MTSAIKWSDIIDDDLNLDDVEGFVTTVGDIKTATTFVDGPEGLVKVMTKSKIHRRVDRYSQAAEARKLRMINQRGPIKDDVCTTCEETFIDLPRNLRKVEDDVDDGLPPEKEPPSGLPMLRKDAIKDKFTQLRILDGNTDVLGDDAAGDAHAAHDREEPEPAEAAKYALPRGRFPQKEDCTVRVTNLSEETKEEDVEELFGRIGKISRIYLAKDRETKSSKGFAFITYDDRRTAEKAIRTLDRHGHDSLLLKVEWAKPSTKGRE